MQIIQRRCQKCEGSGLVMRGRFARKCPECGGFFPWQVLLCASCDLRRHRQSVSRPYSTKLLCLSGYMLPRAVCLCTASCLILITTRFALLIQGWRRFFTSTALPGNGGPLRQPRGQTSIFYKYVPGTCTIPAHRLQGMSIPGTCVYYQPRHG